MTAPAGVGLKGLSLLRWGTSQEHRPLHPLHMHRNHVRFDTNSSPIIASAVAAPRALRRGSHHAPPPPAHCIDALPPSRSSQHPLRCFPCQTQNLPFINVEDSVSLFLPSAAATSWAAPWPGANLCALYLGPPRPTECLTAALPAARVPSMYETRQHTTGVRFLPTSSFCAYVSSITHPIHRLPSQVF